MFLKGHSGIFESSMKESFTELEAAVSYRHVTLANMDLHIEFVTR
jgi:hypothetical protein